MGLLGKISQFLKALLLVVLQDILIVSKVTFLIELVTGSRQRDVARCTNVGGSILVGGRPIYSSSAVQITKINTEGSDELDGEGVEVVNNHVGHQSSTSPSQPPSKRFQSRLIPSTPRNLQPNIATIPTSLPPASRSSSHSRPAMNPEVRSSPIKQSRTSPIVTSKHLRSEYEKKSENY
ncbi:hypothetical protein O181_071983 [Austropuccinia psidii MF-1]|uniref:Uncharacterized protein n=1 Tax=Austropuccinia psidii MF-1 TaxID=1389203 RepID=A0A9Q3I8P6_9BASI|nr:hypothetical protein [Austropuccinia psidii MF-1]